MKKKDKTAHDEADELFDILPGKSVNGSRDANTTKLYMLYDSTTDNVHFFDSARKVAKLIGCSAPNISQRIKHAITRGYAKTVSMSDAKMVDLSFKNFVLTVLIVPIIDVMEGYCEFFDEHAISK